MTSLEAADEARLELDCPFGITPFIYCAYHVFFWVWIPVPSLTLAVLSQLFGAENNSAQSN